MKLAKGWTLSYIFAALAVVGYPSAVLGQGPNQGRLRGALIGPDLTPTTATAGTRAVKSELEKREELREFHKQNPAPPFDPNRKLYPPQLPSAGSTTTDVRQATSPVTGKKDTSAVLPVAPAGPPIGGNAYESKGPISIDFGQSENAQPVNRAIGAANSIAPHPTNPDIVYAGFVNGGIWKTSNATAASPTWVPQTDNIGSLSIGDITFDPADVLGNTLVAGIGRFSSLGGVGGKNIGILRTTDGGANWTVINGGGILVGKNIRAVIARGSTIVIAVNIADVFSYPNIGIFRSINGGASFTQISSAFGSGLPGGRCFDMQADPVNPLILYAAIYDAGAANGVYKSSNTGQTWTKVTSPEMDTAFNPPGINVSNSRLAVGPLNNVYAAVVQNGRLSHVFQTLDGGTNWTSMGVPTTNEGGSLHGINVGGQGSIHLSIATEPTQPTVVYIGGDRQPGSGDPGAGFPNSLGAVNYSGRLFRGDTLQPIATRWQHLTHANNLGVAGGGTASKSAPHADSRDMAVDLNGRLIQGDDGGIYLRTLPTTNAGDWFSLQGSLITTEVHDVAYDAVSNKIITGTQDNGTPEQHSDNTWRMVSSGDGGDVAVDDFSVAGQSTRYSSFQNLGNLRRRVYNSAGSVLSQTNCTLALLGGSPQITPQFYTPIQVNKVNGTSLIIGGQNGVYESTNQGDSVTRVATFWAGDGFSGIGLDYGGWKNGIANPSVIYGVDGNTAYTRTAPGSTFSSLVLPTGGQILLDVAMDTENYSTAYCVDQNQVFRLTNDGTASTDITGDLGDVGAIRCVEFVPNSTGGTISIGTQTGVYVAQAPTPTLWKRLGTNLPASAYVFDVEYDKIDNVLVAGTLGRGVWMIENASSVVNGSAVADWQHY